MDKLTENEGMNTERWLIGEAVPVKLHLLRSIGWALFAGLIIILQARLLSIACHRIVIEKHSISAMLWLPITIGLLALLRGLAAFLGERASARAGAVFKQKVRTFLYRKIITNAPGRTGNDNTASLVETVTSGVDALEPYVTRFLPNLILAALLPLLTIVFVIPSEWRAGAILLFSAPFIPVFMVLINRGSENINRRQWSRLAILADHLFDLIQGLPDLKICSAAKHEAETIAKASEAYRHSVMGVLRVAFLSAFTLEFFTTVGTAVVAVTIGFMLLGGNLSLVDGLFVLLLAPEFYLPMRVLGLSYHSRMQGLASAERILPLLAENTFQPMVEKGSPVPAAPLTIEFSGVTYKYSEGRGGVENIHLLLTHDSVTLLTGESGAGKSTLAKMILGLSQPHQGIITVNGLDLAGLDRTAWMKQITWVPQSPFFFKGTVRDNLQLGLPPLSDSTIMRALDAASALEFVQCLPSGLDSQLGDRGAGLSGGELKRLALGRAFLRDTPLVILDEPTAELDAENETALAESIKKLARGRTVLVISHRSKLREFADRIVLMDDGGIARISQGLSNDGGAE